MGAGSTMGVKHVVVAVQGAQYIIKSTEKKNKLKQDAKARDTSFVICAGKIASKQEVQHHE